MKVLYIIPKVHLHTSPLMCKLVAKNLAGKSQSSQAWIKRQLADPYIYKTKIHNFRCRSAFKLLEMNDKKNIIKPGMLVIDCGAAPGSWCQVAATLSNSNNKIPGKNNGKVIGIDLKGMAPIEGVELLYPYDMKDLDTHEKLRHCMGDCMADVVLCDIAPNATGAKQLDHDNIVEIAYSVLRFTLLNSKKGGDYLIKLWDGSKLQQFKKDVERYYNLTAILKPAASRNDSAELYLYAHDFKGLA